MAKRFSEDISNMKEPKKQDQILMAIELQVYSLSFLEKEQ